MSSKPTKAASTNTTSHMFSAGKSKNLSRSMTSDSIASDIAAFKRRGGHIEVLGNTPFPARAQTTAFRSKGNTQAAPAKAAARG